MKLIVPMNSHMQRTVFGGVILRLASTCKRNGLYPIFVKLKPTNSMLCAVNLRFVAFTCIPAFPSVQAFEMFIKGASLGVQNVVQVLAWCLVS